MFDGSWQLDSHLTWRTLIDVGLVAVLIYQLLLLLRGTRSGAVLLMVALLFTLFYMSQDGVLDLPTVNWMLDRFISSIVVLLVVLFQDDIRRALAGVMRSPLAAFGRDGKAHAQVSEVLRAAKVLSQRGIGALIVIERDAPLDRYVEQGVTIDGKVGWQLLLSLFIPSHRNPTHDGAVVIAKGRIAAAACFLPLAQGDDLPSQLGSRHRAALGLADETDALVIVVSEETGLCAVALMGQLDVDLPPKDLGDRLRGLLGDEGSDGGGPQRRWRRRIIQHGAGATRAVTQTSEFGFEGVRASVQSAKTRPQQDPPTPPPVEPPPSPVQRVAQLAVITAEHLAPPANVVGTTHAAPAIMAAPTPTAEVDAAPLSSTTQSKESVKPHVTQPPTSADSILAAVPAPQSEDAPSPPEASERSDGDTASDETNDIGAAS